MRYVPCLMLVLGLTVGGCAMFKKGYRVCVSYLGAEVCLDKPNGGTNQVVK
jgi:hypothetical protein